jgi:hypothetical protein
VRLIYLDNKATKDGGGFKGNNVSAIIAPTFSEDTATTIGVAASYH